MLELETIIGDNIDINNRYFKAKNEWENIIKTKSEEIIFRSKANWVEHGEKCTICFLT
jgi:hypothetical protein